MKLQLHDKTDYIVRKQLDSYFTKIRRSIRAVPQKGWLAEIREALQMTTSQMAKRLGVPQSNVSIFEKGERNKTITLHSLERAAQALECDLFYVLVPKQGLEKELNERAKKLYELDEQRLEHQMKLEGQGGKSQNRKALEMAMLIINKDKRLWEDLD